MTDFVFESPTKDPLKKNVYAMHNQESEYKQGSKYRIRYRGNNSMNDEDNNDSSFESIETDQIQKSAKKQGDHLESEQVKFGVKLDWCDQSEGKSNKMKSTSNKSAGIGDSQASSNQLRSNNNKLLITPSRLFTSCSKNYLETPNIKMANQANYLRSFQSNQGKTQVIIPPYSRKLFQDNSDDEEKQPKLKKQQQEDMAIENDNPNNNNNNCDQQKTQINTKQSEMISTFQKKIDQQFDIPLNKNNMTIELSKEQELITTKTKIFNPTESTTSSMIKKRAVKQMISNNKCKDRLFDTQKEVKFPIQTIGFQNEVKLIDGAQIDQSCRLAKQFSVLSIMSSNEQGVTVRRCECALTGDQYAIKSIYLGNNLQENDNKIDLLKQFWTYAPGLLRVKSLWISENDLFLVSPLCRGNLIHLKSSLKANQPLLIQLISDICSALDFLHQKGYSHCNIKPENILLQKHKFKLADFGLSSLQPINLNPKDNIFVEDQTDDILQFGKILSELIEEQQPQEQNKTSQQEMSHLILVNIIRLMIHPDKMHRPSAREILDKLPSQPGIQQSKQFALLFQENQILKRKVEELEMFQNQTIIQQNGMLH